MSGFFKKLLKQGDKLVLRDEDNKVVKVMPMPKPLKGETRIKTWRAQMRAGDITGIDDFIALRNIAHGVPQQRKLPDGSVTEWQVPSISDQRQALTQIIEFRFGKAVAQTEVLKAEQETEDMEAYSAMSDEVLLAALDPYLERVAAKKQISAGEVPSDTTDKGDDE